MRKVIALTLLALVAGASAEAGVIRLAAKGVKHGAPAVVKATKASLKTAGKVIY